jgi:hypothetical protein
MTVYDLLMVCTKVCQVMVHVLRITDVCVGDLINVSVAAPVAIVKPLVSYLGRFHNVLC